MSGTTTGDGPAPKFEVTDDVIDVKCDCGRIVRFPTIDDDQATTCNCGRAITVIA